MKSHKCKFNKTGKSDKTSRNMNISGLIIFILIGLVFFRVSSTLLSADSSFLRTVQKLRERINQNDKKLTNGTECEYQENNDTLFIEDTNLKTNNSELILPEKKSEFIDDELVYLELRKDFDNLEGVYQDYSLSDKLVRDEILNIQGEFRVEIFKDEFSLFLMKGDSLIKRYYVGIGKNPDGKTKVREGDNRTPEGNFKYLRPEPSSNWEFNGEKVYGPWFLRLETEPFKGIGIHGTDTVDVIGTRCTRGCIRMYNESITELKEILPVGSMVNIYRSFIKNKR